MLLQAAVTGGVLRMSGNICTYIPHPEPPEEPWKAAYRKATEPPSIDPHAFKLGYEAGVIESKQKIAELESRIRTILDADEGDDW